MRHLIGPMAAAMCLVAACSSASPSFALTGASVDPTYFCPGGAKDAPYDLHATISAHNGTGSAVNIRSVTAEMTLAAVKGDWLEKAGSRYEAGTVPFTPATVGPGSSAALKITIPSACTSDKYGGIATSYGEFPIAMHATASSAPLTIPAADQHELIPTY